MRIVLACVCLALLAPAVSAQCNMADHATCIGYIHNGSTPTGKEVKLGGLDAYLAVPGMDTQYAGPSSLVLLYTDIFGWQLPNIRLWADELAHEGFVAVVPDFFKNNSWSPARAAAGENIGTWLGTYSDAQVLNETIAVVADLRSKQDQYGVVLGKLGTEGFCWGGRYVVLSLGSAKIASAGVAFHASRTTADLVSAIQAPISFQQSDPATDNNLNTTVYAQFEKILADKKAAGLPTEITFYPGQPHGFALRGDDKNATTVKAAAEAFEAGTAWLKKYLA